MPVDLSVELFGRKFKNPVMVASGTFGGLYGSVYDVSRLGAIVWKTVTLEPRKGNPPPRIFEVAGGALNSIGLENPGVDVFLSSELPKYLEEHKTWHVLNIAGKSSDEFAILAEKIEEGIRDKSMLAAIELNLSCPNVSGGLDFSTVPSLAGETVKKAKSATGLPLIAKLSPNVTDIVEIAGTCVNAGADAISLINTIKAMAVDWRTGKSRLGSITGGLSGSAIKPIALRFVHEVKKAFPETPVIGIGGISSAEDAMEFFCVGASLVQIGTASFVDVDLPVRIVEDLGKLMPQMKRFSAS